MKYSCLVFSEGGRDKNFLMVLIDLPKFKYHTKKWIFNYDHASGSSPEIILKQCKNVISNANYDLVLCFIDLDKLKSDHKKTWRSEKKELEIRYSDIMIVWQIDKAEDEYKKVLGDLRCGKYKLNKVAKQRVKEFVNSDFWKRILKPIKNKEQELRS